MCSGGRSTITSIAAVEVDLKAPLADHHRPNFLDAPIYSTCGHHTIVPYVIMGLIIIEYNQGVISSPHNFLLSYTGEITFNISENNH